MTPTVTIESREGGDDELVVLATYRDATGTRTGTYRLELPHDASDEQVAAAILALFPQPAPPPEPEPTPND